MDLKLNMKRFGIYFCCENDWAGDTETKKVLQDPLFTSWTYLLLAFKGRRNTTHSSTEAVREIKFIYYLLKDIQVEMTLPDVVETDNVGVIFMSKNVSTGVRTRHVDTCYDFVQELIEDICTLKGTWLWRTKKINQELYEQRASF